MNCDRCGEAVHADREVCPSCGADLTGAGPPEGTAGQQPRADQDRPRREHGNAGQQGHRQSPRGQARGGRRPQDAGTGGNGGSAGLSRRQVLGVGGLAVAAGGVYLLTGSDDSEGDSGDSGNSNDGPKGVVRQYLTAFGNENVEKVNSLLHPEGPASSRGGLSESYYDGVDSFETTIEGLTLAEEDETSALVEAEYTITRTQDGESQTAPYSENIVLRTQEGDWLIYSFQ